jgi:hypothetical protein
MYARSSAGIHRLEAEHVAQKGAIRFGVAAVEQNVSPEDHARLPRSRAST